MRKLTNIVVLILLIVFLIWARAFSMIQVFMPVDANPEWSDIASYVAVTLAVGGIFASITFAASAFALPLKPTFLSGSGSVVGAAFAAGFAVALGGGSGFGSSTWSEADRTAIAAKAVVAA